MPTTLNWAKLVTTGQAKAFGLPWTHEEHAAVLAGISPDYVRLGIFTKEALEERLAKEADEQAKTGEVPLMKRNKEDLLFVAHQLGIPALSVIGKEDLVRLIEEKQGAPKKKTENTATEVVAGKKRGRKKKNG